MKILKTTWFSTAKGTIGIVLGEDSVTKEKKAYIGIGDGENPNVDSLYIATLQQLELNLTLGI